MHTRRPLIHSLFTLCLLGLFALGAWWSTFFMRAVGIERQAGLDRLTHSAQAAAMMAGHVPEHLAPGPFPGTWPLEVVQLTGTEQDEGAVPLMPFHPHLGLRPEARAVAAIEAKAARRRLMVMGESTLLFLLFGACSAMLIRMVQQDRRHLRDMEAFVAAVTHEMKTPLAGMKGLLETFAAGRIPPEQTQRLLAMGLVEAERLEHTIENVLLAGSLGSGRLEVLCRPLELTAWLDHWMGHRQRLLQGQEGSVGLQALPAPPLWVSADGGALRTILDNLLDNALKYGGPAPQVRLELDVQPGRVRLAVVDQGLGFAPEDAEHLFQRFTRGRTAAARASKGTGLGLPIARSLAQAMGGQLRAESAGPGQGSRFTLELRREEA